MKGLIIKEQWINLILEGKKIWEIRGSHAHKRETIALIKSGSKKIFGTVEIVDSLSLTEEEYYDAVDKHCIKDAREIGKPYRKIHAWVLQNPKILKEPIPYNHPIGAVIWVNLDDSLLK